MVLLVQVLAKQWLRGSQQIGPMMLRMKTVGINLSLIHRDFFYFDVNFYCELRTLARGSYRRIWFLDIIEACLMYTKSQKWFHVVGEDVLRMTSDKWHSAGQSFFHGNSMERRPWETNSVPHLAGEIPHVLLNTEVHYHFHKCSPFAPTLNQISQLHAHPLIPFL